MSAVNPAKFKITGCGHTRPDAIESTRPTSNQRDQNKLHTQTKSPWSWLTSALYHELQFRIGLALGMVVAHSHWVAHKLQQDCYGRLMVRFGQAFVIRRPALGDTADSQLARP